MIRSFLLSLIVFVLLVGAFALYWLEQPRVTVQSSNKQMKVPTTAPTDVTQMQIGPANHAWVNSYDKTGRLTSQFNADDYTPTGGNEFAVTRPVCVFYMVGGQTVTLTGDSGVVYVDPGKKSSGGFAVASASSPNRGRLKHVHIDLYPPRAARPTQWMDTDNIAFDNDTLRIFTESFVDSAGSTVEADRVPVAIRGDEYEFDGQGMILRWNDRDGRVQLLEIAHGDRLLVKDTRKVSTPFSTVDASPAAKEPPPPAGSAAAEAAGKPTPAVTPAAHPSEPAAEPQGPTTYQAIFEKNVRIFQDGKLTGTGDTLTTLFITGHAPAVAPTVRPAAIPSTHPVATTAPASLRIAAATKPTTEPEPSSAIVLWTGKLRVTPVESSPLPLSPAVGSTVVRLDGIPALLAPNHATLSAASVTYRTGDGAAVVEPSVDVPLVRFADERGVRFAGERIVYNPATQIATLSGPASLVQPVENQPNQFLTANWAGDGLLHVIPRANQPDFVDHVDLHNAVVVSHPQFHLTSDELAISLSRAPRTSATTSPTVRVDQAVATGRAVAIISRPGEAKREIDGDRLALNLMPDASGKSAPHEVLADGHVYAFDPAQRLTAGHLDALLGPKDADDDAPNGDDSSLAIQTVHATDAVHVELHNGTVADSDELWLTTPNGHNQIDLLGTPAARVHDNKNSVLSGNHIRLLPDNSYVRVLGPGTLDTVRVSDKGEPPKKIHVTWTHELDVNGDTNKVDADGSVTAITKRPDGTTDTLIGDHAHANLVDASPTTRPTTATTSPAEQVAGGKNREGHEGDRARSADFDPSRSRRQNASTGAAAVRRIGLRRTDRRGCDPRRGKAFLTRPASAKHAAGDDSK